MTQNAESSLIAPARRNLSVLAGHCPQPAAICVTTLEFNMKTITVFVNVEVEVTIDESAFTPELIKKYAEDLRPLPDIEAHVDFLAELAALGKISGDPEEFVEGYGRLGDMGIRVSVVDVEVEQA
jgi:hypothetical protein